MKTFNHFIITRFNIKQDMWQSDKIGNIVNNNKWLENRYDLFKKFCFPSIINQSNKDFKWLVYFDIDMPQKFKDINRDLAFEFSNFIPVYVRDFKDFEDSLSKVIKSYLNINVKYVITTRLDNDDSFHKDAVATIQHNFEPSKRLILDLINGLTLQIGHQYKLGLRKNVESGPFISLVEDVRINEPLITVYDREHTSWKNDIEFKIINDNYYWLQIVHERNISNSLSNDLTFNKSYLKGFDFLDTIKFKPSYYLFIILKKINFFKLLKTLKIK